MRKLMLIVFMMVFTLNLSAQLDSLIYEDDDTNEYISPPPEEDADFPGGSSSLLYFINSNLVYPEQAVKEGIEGRVFARFVVEIDGSLSDIKLLRGIGYGCDEEAIRLIQLMPKWKPAYIVKTKTPIRQQFVMPINFEIALKEDIDEPPHFPGGDEALFNFIENNLNYPNIEADVQGSVLISFIVEKDGSITNISIERGLLRQFDQEAIRVVKLMPKWEPGQQRDRIVRTLYTFPIKFNLQ